MTILARDPPPLSSPWSGHHPLQWTHITLPLPLPLISQFCLHFLAPLVPSPNHLIDNTIYERKSSSHQWTAVKPESPRVTHALWVLGAEDAILHLGHNSMVFLKFGMLLDARSEPLWKHKYSLTLWWGIWYGRYFMAAHILRPPLGCDLKSEQDASSRIGQRISPFMTHCHFKRRILK